MNWNIYLIAKLFTALQFMLFSIFLFTQKSNKLSNRILAGFLFINGINFLILLFIPSPSGLLPILTIFRYGILLLIGPLLYFYTQSRTVSGFQFKDIKR